MSYKVLVVINVILLIWAGYTFIHYFAVPKSEIFSGENWTAKKFGDTYYLSVNNHSELVAAMTDFVNATNITAGQISGIGAVNTAVLRFFNPQTKKYIDKTFDEQMEISNLSGNISTKDGEKIIHLHITLGDQNYRGFAGHLLSARISGAGEFVINIIPQAQLHKKYDDNSGLNFFDFKK